MPTSVATAIAAVAFRTLGADHRQLEHAERSPPRRSLNRVDAPAGSRSGLPFHVVGR
jgi:hypothetical protein